MMEKQEGFLRRSWRMLYPGFIYTGALFIATFIATTGITTQMIVEGFDVNDMEAFLAECMARLSDRTLWVSLGSYVITIPLMFLLMRSDTKRDYAAGTKRHYEKPGAVTVLSAALLGVGYCVTGNNLLEISGVMEVFSDTAEQLADATYNGLVIPEVIIFGILAPFTEELVYRAVTQKRMADYMTPVMAMVLAAILFGLNHGNVPQFLYAGGMGVFCGYLYKKYHSVIPAVALHIGCNTCGILLSELGFGETVLSDDTLYIIYIVVGAAITIAALWFLYSGEEPKVLIPSEKDREAENKA